MLQSSIFWAISLVFYWFLLRHETYFQMNRIYLLGTFCLGLCLPFIATMPVSAAANVLPPEGVITYIKPTFMAVKATTSDVSSFVWTYPRLLRLLYSVGSLIAFVRFAISLRYLLRLLRKSEKATYKGYIIVYSEAINAPFSFAKYIFLNTNFKTGFETNTSESLDNQLIIAHEIAHIRQWHSFDILFLEICSIFFWWNPLIYFYKNRLRDIHEYLADAAATKHSSRKNYAKLLVEYALRLQTNTAHKTVFEPVIAHSFFHSQLQQRIFMLTKQPSAFAALSKYTLLFPLFCGLFFSFNTALLPQETPNKLIDSKRFATVKNIERVASILGLAPNAELQSFEITYIKPESDPYVYGNHRPQLEQHTQELMQQAAPGDTYYFDNVMVKEGGTVRKIAAKCTIVASENNADKISVKDFKAMKTLNEYLKTLNLPANTAIQSFEIFRAPDSSKGLVTAYSYENKTSEMEARTIALTQEASIGDTYYFDKIMLKGDTSANKLFVRYKIIE